MYPDVLSFFSSTGANNIFFHKRNLIFIYIWVNCISEIFKTFLEWIQTYDDALFSNPIWPTSPGQDFFKKLEA